MSVDSWFTNPEQPIRAKIVSKYTHTIPFTPGNPLNPDILTLSPLPCATIEEDYNVALNGQGVGTLSYSLISGSLPPGLTLSPDGVISGVVETFSPQIRSRNTSGEVITTYDLDICCPGPIPATTTTDKLIMNITLVRGDTLSFDLVVYLNGVSVDITGATFRMTAKWSVENDDADAVFIKTSDPVDGIVVTDAPNGGLSITLQPADTIDLPDHTTNLNYDVQMVDASSAVYTILWGTLTVLVDVSVQAP